MEKGRIASAASAASAGFIIPLCLTVAILAAYWPVQKHDFINFDDNEYVNDNPHVTSGLTKGNVVWAFTKCHSSNWHPVTWISHMVDCELFGLNAGAHHLMNLYIHIANTLLLFYLLKLTTNTVWRSACVAAFFVLYPLHVESVAWIAERKDVLSTFFLFLTLIAYYYYTLRPRRTSFACMTVWYILGLMTKPMLVTLPFLLLIMDYWPLGRFGRNDAAKDMSINQGLDPRKQFISLLIEKIPLFALSAAVSVGTIFVQKSFHALSNRPFLDRIPNVIFSYAHYLVSTVLPCKLAVFYSFPDVFVWWKTVAVLLLLSFASIGIIKLQKKHPWLIMGWLWYIGSLLPVIGIIQVGAQARADRYTYVPLVGIFIIVVWGVCEIIQKSRHRKTVTGILLFYSIAGCFVATRLQLNHWKNSVTLFSHSIKVAGGNTLTFNNLGLAFLIEGHLDSAVYYLNRSIQIKPDFRACMNLGTLYSRRNDFRKSVFYYRKALELDSTHEDAYNETGTAYYILNNLDSATWFFTKGRKLNLLSWKAYNGLGLVCAGKNEFQKAFVYFMDAIAQCGSSASSGIPLCNLADLLLKKGKLNSAKDLYTRSIHAGHNNENAYRGRGLVYFMQNNCDSSLSDFQTAVRLKPDFALAQEYLGRVFRRIGQLDSAELHSEMARNHLSELRKK